MGEETAAEKQIVLISAGVATLKKYTKDVKLTSSFGFIGCNGPEVLEEGDAEEMAQNTWSYDKAAKEWVIYIGRR